MEAAISGDSESGAQLLARLGSKPCLKNLDENLLPGGLQPKDVVELHGESSSGKTQCLLHLLSRCLLPSEWKGAECFGFGIGVIFIDTDYHFNLIRLVNIMETSLTAYFTQKSSVPCETDLEDLIKTSLSRLHLYRCSTSHQFAMTLFSLENIFSQDPQISVLMIDSVSSFYWSDRHAGGDKVSIQEKPLTMATKAMDSLRTTYHIAVIATSSVLIQKRNEDPCEYSDYLCKPWVKLVTRRIVLKKNQTEFTAFQNCNGQKLIKPFSIQDFGIVFDY